MADRETLDQAISALFQPEAQVDSAITQMFPPKPEPVASGPGLGSRVKESAVGILRKIGTTLDFTNKIRFISEGRRPDLWTTAVEATVRPNTPEGIMASAEWPSAKDRAQRVRAVAEYETEVFNQLLESPDTLDPQVANMVFLQGDPMLGEPPFIPNPAGLRRAQQLGLITDFPPEALNIREAQIAEEDSKPWMKFSVNVGWLYPGDSIVEAQQKFLDQHEHSEVSQQIVKYANNINSRAEVDFETDKTLDITIQNGMFTNLGHELSEVTIKDPLFILGFTPANPKIYKPLTMMDEAARVGILPKLAQQMDEAKALAAELEAISSPKLRAKLASQKAQIIDEVAEAQTQLIKAGDAPSSVQTEMFEETGKGPLHFLKELDPEVVLQAETQERVHSAVLTQARSSLIGEGASEEIADQIISRGGRVSKKLVDDPLLAKRLQRASAPMRSWLEYLKTQKQFAFSQQAGVVTRAAKLKELYDATDQTISSLRLRALEDMTALGLHEENAKRLVAGIPHGKMQAVVEDLIPLNTDNRSGEILSRLIGKSALGTASRAMTDNLMMPPTVVLKNTEAYDILKRAERATTQQLRNWKEVTNTKFKWLRLSRNPKDLANTAVYNAASPLSRAERRTLDEKMGKFLWSLPARELDNISRTPKSWSGETLTLEEGIHLRDAREFLDEIVTGLQESGLKIDSGASMKEVFETLFPKGNHIPIDLIDVVEPNIYFAHRLPQSMQEQITKEMTPVFTEAIEKLAPLAAHRMHYIPAIEASKKSAKLLRPGQQKYAETLYNFLEGKPNAWDSLWDRGLNSAMDQFEKIPGVRVPKKLRNRPAYRTSAAVQNAFYRSLLGGMLSTGMNNLAQSINTASRYGPLHMLEGIAAFSDKDLRKVFKDQQLLDGFDSLFTQNMGGLQGFGFDNLNKFILSPIRSAEFINRGIAFWTGISHAAKRAGVNGFKEWSKLDPKEQQALLGAGIDAVETTQFIYGRLGQAPFFQNALAKNMTTLATFPVKQAEFLTNQMMEDPSGLVRYFALTGMLTRLNREMLGVSVDNAVGFGFIPDHMQPYPLASPEVKTLSSLVSYAAARDPKDKKLHFNEFSQGFSQMMAGFAGPGTLVAGVPREALPIGNSILGAPELERDLGSRFATRVINYMRQQRAMEKRDANGKYIGPTNTRELVLGLTGAYTVQQEKDRVIYGSSIEGPGQVDFERNQFLENISYAMQQKDQEAYDRLWKEAQKNGLFVYSELFDPGRLQGSAKGFLAAPYIERNLRQLMYNPGLGATPTGEGLVDQEEQ